MATASQSLGESNVVLKEIAAVNSMENFDSISKEKSTGYQLLTG